MRWRVLSFGSAVALSAGVHMAAALLLEPGQDAPRDSGDTGVVISLGPAGLPSGGGRETRRVADLPAVSAVAVAEAGAGGVVQSVGPADMTAALETPDSASSAVAGPPDTLERVEGPPAEAVVAPEAKSSAAVASPDPAATAEVVEKADLPVTGSEPPSVPARAVEPAQGGDSWPSRRDAKQRRDPAPSVEPAQGGDSWPRAGPDGEPAGEPQSASPAPAAPAGELRGSAAPATQAAVTPDRAIRTEDGSRRSSGSAEDRGERSGAGASGPGVAGRGGEASGSVPGARADYHAMLRIWLEKHKRYPRRARLRREQGVVVLRFAVTRAGAVTDLDIEKSSGHPLLDGEARKMVRRAQPLPEMPPSMQESRTEVLVPIRFTLR